ncbi:MAG TPA: BCCT family transporter [Anaerovoracaceae bacterium]|nr:BCCT family transporter [Anaerovoracaceae bacterium]
MKTNESSFGKGIYKAVFIPATAVTLIFGVFFFVYPEQSNTTLNNIHAFTTNELGWFFLIFTVAMLFLCMYYAFSRMGNIVLGEEGEKPQYKTWTWLGMIFSSGTGGSLLYLSSIEWIWIVDAPPFGLEPRSQAAYDWAMAYGMFHWGPSAWALYMAVSIPIGYFFFVKRKKNMKMSDYARPLLGNYSDGIAGHTLNFLYIFGLLGGVLTSLALGTPAIASGFVHAFGLESSNIFIDTLVIALWTFIPLFVFLFGLQKGFSVISRFNIWASAVLIGVILVFGPTWFIFNNSSDGLGIMLTNFFNMSLFTDAVGQGGFPQAWTIFYMSWWIVYALPFGLFIAKISKGRTIRQTVLGGLGAGSLGCMIFYMVLPSFGMKLQLDGTVDLFASLAEKGRGGVIIDMFKNAPGGLWLPVIFSAFVLLHYITGHFAVGYSLAACCEKRLTVDQDPQKWNVAFWLILAGIVSLGLYLLNPNALAPLQTVSIITGFPLCFAMLVLIFSYFRQIKKDFPDGIPYPTDNSGRLYGKSDNETDEAPELKGSVSEA